MPEVSSPRIAVISHLYPQRGREGYGVFVAEQVRALTSIGAQVTQVVVPVPWAPWPLSAIDPKWRRYSDAETSRTDFDGVPVDLPRHLSLPRRMMPDAAVSSAYRAIVSAPALMSRLADSDIIVAHTALVDGRLAARLSRRLDIPYVVVVHGEDLYQLVRGDSDSLRAKVAEALRGASAVIGVSSAVARGLQQAFGDLAGVHVLHNGVDTSMFSPAEEEPGAPAASMRPVRLLSAGHLVERKAHAFVLRAVAQLVARGIDVELTVAGDGPERQHLESLASDLRVAEHVRFTGAYRHEELPALMRAADLFVLPSWDEAFGVVYLEALACGIPVIAASDEGAPDIVENGVDGYLVPPRDVEAIATAIAAFAGLDAPALADMRRAARRKALGFTWEANARGLLEVLGGVVTRGDDAPRG